MGLGRLGLGLVRLVGLGVTLGGLGLGLVLSSRLCRLLGGLVVRLVRGVVVRVFMVWLALGGRGRRLFARRVTMIVTVVVAVMVVPTMSWG